MLKTCSSRRPTIRLKQKRLTPSLSPAMTVRASLSNNRSQMPSHDLNLTFGMSAEVTGGLEVTYPIYDTVSDEPVSAKLNH